MIQVKIGGVPEHFNYPWYLTLKDKLYQKEGINLRWEDFPGGTGQMNQALREGRIDLAVILTEGVVRDIVHGNPSRIVQVFVNSPLIWGVHVAAQSAFESVAELQGKRAAISRMGSGSHLMAYLQAQNMGWDTQEDLSFVELKNLDGALKGLPDGAADYFLWEKFTTKPYVDQGIFRCVGTVPTPWPCFVIAARTEFIEQQTETLQTILQIINANTSGFKEIEGIDALLAKRYDQKIEDIQQWLSMTEWSENNLSKDQLTHVQQSLIELGLIEEAVDYQDICTQIL